MVGSHDFEQAWLAKLGRAIDEIIGKDVRAQTMAGSERLSDDSDRQDVIERSRWALEHLAACSDGERIKRVTMRCGAAIRLA